jgi:hypothetical protein
VNLFTKVSRRSAMKDKCFIYYGNPCVICLADPAVQSFEDAEKGGRRPCQFYPERRECSPPSFGCVQLAGAAMARYVIQFYSEATEDTLAMEREEFRRRAPLPPGQVEAYVDPSEQGYQRITDPEQVVQRVWEYARAVLDLKPGERIFRSAEETWTPPLGEPGARSAPNAD